MDYFTKSLDLHKKLKGKIETLSKVELLTKDDLSLAYSP
jgi:malate dehydrogenase (oxaloacetate-decarboxylating)